MSTHVVIQVSGFKGTPEELAKALEQMPDVIGVRPIADSKLKLPAASVDSPPEALERADDWLREEMRDLDFVPSDEGGLKLGGKRGYFSGGPGLAAITIFNFFRKDPEIINMTEPYPYHPLDAEDLNRCLRLFEYVLEWRARMSDLGLFPIIGVS